MKKRFKEFPTGGLPGGLSCEPLRGPEFSRCPARGVAGKAGRPARRIEFCNKEQCLKASISLYFRLEALPALTRAYWSENSDGGAGPLKMAPFYSVGKLEPAPGTWPSWNLAISPVFALLAGRVGIVFRCYQWPLGKLILTTLVSRIKARARSSFRRKGFDRLRGPLRVRAARGGPAQAVH
jgi:hypothetical protein